MWKNKFAKIISNTLDHYYLLSFILSIHVLGFAWRSFMSDTVNFLHIFVMNSTVVHIKYMLISLMKADVEEETSRLTKLVKWLVASTCTE